MSDTPYSPRNSDLRSDLRTIRVEGHRRPYRIVVDELSGSFSRVSERIWQLLQRGDGDPSLWQQARIAGWTRQRPPLARGRISPLAIRIPIGSIDSVAKRLLPHSGMLFSWCAVLFWSASIVLAGLLAASRSVELSSTLGSLQQFLLGSNALMLAAVFVATKIVHELSHAVMCRRMGSRCGEVGILFLVGMPCPYCDVTEIWRQPSALRRAAVMSAGIYVELIVASLATFVWAGATDPVIRLHALNVMVVCGVSTLIFNANPLMRYDGYFVLADALGSVNLRQEARDAFASVMISRFAGRDYQIQRRGDPRSVGLALFCVASTVYRAVVLIAIAAMLVGVAAHFHLRGVAMIVVLIVTLTVIRRSANRVVGAVGGAGNWGRVGRTRRAVCGIAVCLAGASLLLIPTPRYRSATGWVDAANATSVYVPVTGMVQNVAKEFGQRVEPGDSLVKLVNESLAIEHARTNGQYRVAKLRSSLARRVALDGVETADHWQSLQAAEDAAASRLVAAQSRIRKSEIKTPVGGVVVPARRTSLLKERGFTPSLRDQMGHQVADGQDWCRISPDGSLAALLVIDARDRADIDVGSVVRINLKRSPELAFSSTVSSVSAIVQDEPSVTRQAAFEVLCPLPPVDDGELMSWLGQECQGVFHLPNRALVSDLSLSIREWLGGR